MRSIVRAILSLIALGVILWASFIIFTMERGSGIEMLMCSVGIPLAIAYAVKYFSKSHKAFLNVLVAGWVVFAALCYYTISATFY